MRPGYSVGFVELVIVAGSGASAVTLERQAVRVFRSDNIEWRYEHVCVIGFYIAFYGKVVKRDVVAAAA